LLDTFSPESKIQVLQSSWNFSWLQQMMFTH